VSLPKITIITPSYNQGRYLEQTFKSVLMQDYPNLEWFVVDGGSTDGSVDLIKRYEKHFTWWVSERDRNHPHALNKGYAKATGEISCFVNSDDVLDPGVLHYVVKQFNEGVDWVVGWAKYFDDFGDEWYYEVKNHLRPTDWLVGNPVPQIASFWRTSIRDKIGDFTEKYLWSFDYEYWLRMYFKGGYRPKVVRRCMGGFRLHSQSKTCAKPENYIPDNKGLFEEYGEFLTSAQRQIAKRELKKKANQMIQNRAWAAINEGDPRRAREHALAAVSDLPTSLEAWRTAFCALRGH
jgi:glycosyltransferase involved in cell wall biosynthesis